MLQLLHEKSCYCNWFASKRCEANRDESKFGVKGPNELGEAKRNNCLVIY